MARAFVTRYFALYRPAHDRIPRTIQRPRGGPIQTTRPPAWCCFAIYADAEIPNPSNDTAYEWQLVAESALTKEQIARYEQEAARLLP